MSRVIESRKKLREEYDELAAKYGIMEQKLEEAHSEEEKLITNFNALKDRVSGGYGLILVSRTWHTDLV